MLPYTRGVNMMFTVRKDKAWQNYVETPLRDLWLTLQKALVFFIRHLNLLNEVFSFQISNYVFSHKTSFLFWGWEGGRVRVYYMHFKVTVNYQREIKKFHLNFYRWMFLLFTKWFFNQVSYLDREKYYRGEKILFNEMLLI